MRNARGRFEFWRGAMIQQNSKDEHANLTRRDSRARTAPTKLFFRRYSEERSDEESLFNRPFTRDSSLRSE
jgi:hypothetical protein